MLKAVGAGIKDGVKETFNKPKEFAHLIRNKFGSADNIPKDGAWSEAGERRELTPTHHVQGHKRTQSGNIGGAWSQGKQVHRHQGSASLPRDAPGSGGSSQPSEHRQSGDVDIPSGLRHFDIPEEDIPSLAADAFKVERLLRNNPRQLSQADIESIYRAAY